ncbi:MAG: DUF2284 domain-containing protein [Oscillospiraceae bacterium]
MNNEQLAAAALEEGFSNAAVIDTEKIVFNEAFRPYCAENLCGKYGANYSCPPDCGTPAEMEARVRAHKHALVLQSICDVDPADSKAVKAAKAVHNASALRLMKKLRAEGHDGFVIGSSGCALCSPCAITEGKPCSFPDLQYSCMSAFCVYVKQLAEDCGMEYCCEKGRLALFGMYVCD